MPKFEYLLIAKKLSTVDGQRDHTLQQLNNVLNVAGSAGYELKSENEQHYTLIRQVPIVYEYDRINPWEMTQKSAEGWEFVAVEQGYFTGQTYNSEAGITETIYLIRREKQEADKPPAHTKDPYPEGAKVRVIDQDVEYFSEIGVIIRFDPDTKDTSPSERGMEYFVEFLGRRWHWYTYEQLKLIEPPKETA